MRYLLALCALLSTAALAQAAPTVTLTVAPNSGAGSVTPVVTWSSTGASTCTASGGWTGTKATSGTQTLPAITASTTYTLTCATTTGEATLTWIAPSENTDGSPLTNLAGFKVYRGVGTGALTLVQTIANPGVVRADLTALPLGLNTFAVSAYSTTGAESALSQTASKTITASTASQSATVAVTTVPKPPTNPVVTQTTAYQVVIRRNLFAFVPVGTVPLKTACVQGQTVNGMTVVPRWTVRFSGSNRPEAVVARCG